MRSGSNLLFDLLTALYGYDSALYKQAPTAKVIWQWAACVVNYTVKTSRPTWKQNMLLRELAAAVVYWEMDELQLELLQARDAWRRWFSQFLCRRCSHYTSPSLRAVLRYVSINENQLRMIDKVVPVCSGMCCWIMTRKSAPMAGCSAAVLTECVHDLLSLCWQTSVSPWWWSVSASLIWGSIERRSSPQVVLPACVVCGISPNSTDFDM